MRRLIRYETLHCLEQSLFLPSGGSYTIHNCSRWRRFLRLRCRRAKQLEHMPQDLAAAKEMKEIMEDIFNA